MKSNTSRRDFLKAIVIAPAIPAFTSFINSDRMGESSAIQIKFKVSLNLYSFNKLLSDKEVDLFDMLRFCAQHNFDAIDPTGYYFPGYPTPPPNEFINEFKREAFLLGLDISGTGVRNDFANPDPVARETDIEHIKQWIEVAAKLGSPNLRIFAGTNSHEGFTRDQVFKWMSQDIRKCCDYGKEFGVIVALQNHNDFIKTADDVDRIFEMVDSDWLGLNLDIGSYRKGDPYAEIEKNIMKAVTWQIKENVWINGKETPVDLKKLFQIIKKAGYRGYLPLETLGAGDPYQKVPNLLNEVRQVLS
ncbi:MAG: sugar phosphate isomerase/epimerase [Fermentimonas sp.]|jgi:sugar phosphate isomerase/epimerase|nr:sugar phosphate isomerase/epimerase [Fermentimonas sp.]NLC86868.1 sugar phosphate isomerase/epimerase [Bacteroidales bacterium]HBT85261.1 sugar phosphate isomerase/epimerase [Porphyromonadaceae bacterium]MDD2931304.1 sugar phosphate isomerase/epimerase [Fermentimonas sp.]MDD3189286.1 sugar phosphate isomerase/epimerase [Fermentimonas sp.]